MMTSIKAFIVLKSFISIGSANMKFTSYALRMDGQNLLVEKPISKWTKLY